MSLLSVRDLHVHFVKRDLGNQIRTAKALNGVTFELEQGQILGMVGETGAGKSLTASSIMGGLPRSAQIARGSIQFEDRELVGLDVDTLNTIRGTGITIIVQSPLTSLDPLAKIGAQLIRVQQEHAPISREEARSRALEMLRAVQIPEPERRLDAWPHEMSGGMAQRILIAMALVNGPRLLIADEPTTGLDVTVQAQVMDLLADLVQSRNMATIIITHDLGVVSHYCTRVAVMFAGTIVESGAVDEVLENPRHPYTRELIDSVPERILDRGYRKVGRAPDLYDLPGGCLFRYRCPMAAEICHSAPPPKPVGPGHVALCHFADRVDLAATAPALS
jgi:oligopeptide/dipeptide ABC transporter ATP-binding protein